MTDPNAAEATPDPVARRVVKEIAVSILLGGAAPYVAYVLLRPHLEEVLSLLIGSVFPAVLELVSFARHRRLDPVSTLNLAALAVSAVIAAMGGSARFMLIKESLVTGAIGTGFLVSLLFQRPAQFYLARQFVTGNLPERVLRYDAAWEAVPYMRTVLRTSTAVWGIAFLLEVSVHIELVFRVSTRQALVFGPLVFYSTMLSVIAWTVFYTRRTRPRIEAMLDRARGGLAPPLAIVASSAPPPRPR